MDNRPATTDDEVTDMESREVEAAGPCTRCWTRVFPRGFYSEFREVFALAWPMLTQFSLGPVSIIFCGRLGKTELDAVALANSMINVTGVSIAVGLSTACDTYFSQIYGSVNSRKLGVALQRSLLIITLATLPCWAIHLNTEALLVLIGQDDTVSRLAGRYMLIFLPGLLAFFIYISLSKYIQNQSIVYPGLLIGLAANIVNAVLHYVFLFHLNWGTDGSAIAQAVSYTCMMLFTVLYILVSKLYKDTWDGWSKDCLLDWGPFFRLAIFGLMMTAIEWWSFEVGVFLTGILGTTELGAQSVLFQLETVAYMVPLGIGIAASIRVGQCLGSEDISGAVTASRVAILIMWIIGLVLGLLFLTLKDFLPLIFTNISDVISLTSSILPILGLYMIADGTAGVCAGILRGSGRQLLGAGVILVTWVILLPTGASLMFFTSLRMSGLWWTLAVGLFAEAFAFLIIVGRTNWQKQMDNAKQRTDVDHLAVCENPGAADADERTPLLSSSSTYEPVDPLIQRHRTSDREEDEPGPEPVYLPGHVLFRRVAVIVLLLGILGLGVLLRFQINIDSSLIDLCIPRNESMVSNTTLKYCNETSLL